MSMFSSLASKFRALGYPDIANPKNAVWRKLTPKHSGTVATAQTTEFDIQSKKLIHKILISIGESTTATGDTEQGTLADDILDIELRTNTGTVKRLKATMCKAIAQISQGKGQGSSTGFYELIFSDPNIPDAMPLPAWLFTPITLSLVDNAPAASNYHHIWVSVLESYIPDSLASVKDWRILYETYGSDKSYGTSTGWQDYPLSTNRDLYGLLYEMDDDGTLSNTEFNMVKLKAEGPGGKDEPIEEMWVTHLREEYTRVYGVAPPTGFIYVDFPEGFDTGAYKDFLTQLNIPTAGTDIGLRVCERYLK